MVKHPFRFVERQTNRTNDHFSAKNKQSISEPNFTKIGTEGLVHFRQFFLEMILSTSQRRCRQGQILPFQEDGQNRKIVIKIEFTPLPYFNTLPFFKGF